MNVLLRADAGESQGTGHVMRCMTLAEALLARGHAVTIMGALGDVPWLTELIKNSGIRHTVCKANELDVDGIAASGFDWVVVDSYLVPSERVSSLNRSTPCLAIVDGDIRGIRADLYLDQNLGASLDNGHELDGRMLAGSSYALVRDAVLGNRRDSTAAQIVGRPRVVAFMGGTDPDGAIVEVAKSIAAQQLDIELDLVTTSLWAGRAESAVAGLAHARLIEPTEDLPTILGSADVIVSAAGTSAWDICTMARPAVLIALVANQQGSLAPIAQAGVALTIDATPGGAGGISETGQLVASLINDSGLRQGLIQRCKATFDGLGKSRVVKTMERMVRA